VIAETLAGAVGLFAVTNVDDLVLLTVLFGGSRSPAGTRRIVAGQYLGFGAILAVSLSVSLGARQLPHQFVTALGVIPLALGARAGWTAWRGRGERGRAAPAPVALTTLAIAGVTLANGADNIGVYVPVFALASAPAVSVYLATFLVLVAVWCASSRWLAHRRPIARALSRWGHVVLPAVLMGIGAAILIGGFRFGY